MSAKVLGSIFCVVLLGSLGGCATAGGDQYAYADPAARHNHVRDAKQGYAASSTPRTEAVKPLHDHRQFK